MRLVLSLAVSLVAVGAWEMSEAQKHTYAKSEIDPSPLARLFVISDVHGDYEALLSALLMAAREAIAPYARRMPDEPAVELPTLFELSDIFLGAMNEGEEYFTKFQNRFPLFKQGKPFFTLVQMGDLIDRGAYGLRCLKTMDLVERVIGFTVVQLVGNHELLAVTDPGWAGSVPGMLHPKDDLERTPANLEFRNGYLWKYIESKMLVMTRVGGSSAPPLDDRASTSAATLFVHGGLTTEFISTMMANPGRDMKNPSHNMWNPAFYNRQMMMLMSDPAVIEQMSKRQLDRWFLKEGPTGTRKMAGPDTNCQDVEYILRYFNVARIVVGHTPQYPSRSINLNCDGLVILTDNLMTQFATPERTGVPALMIMSMVGGRLAGISGAYVRPQVEVIIAGDGTPNVRSHTDKTPRGQKRSASGQQELAAEDVIFKGDAVILMVTEDGGTRGLLLGFKHESDATFQLVNKLQGELKQKPQDGIPQAVDMGDEGQSQKRERTESTSKVYRFFLKATATAMVKPADYTPAILTRMTDIVKYLHDMHICFGGAFIPEELFALGPQGVELVNMSTFMTCSTGQVVFPEDAALKAISDRLVASTVRNP